MFLEHSPLCATKTFFVLPQTERGQRATAGLLMAKLAAYKLFAQCFLGSPLVVKPKDKIPIFYYSFSTHSPIYLFSLRFSSIILCKLV